MVWLALVLLLAHGAYGDSTFLLGAQGEPCDVVCARNYRKCLTSIPTEGTTKLFESLGVKCTKPPARNGTWWASDQPSYVSDPNDPNAFECLGYKDVPDYVSCQAHMAAVRRLCHCGDDNTREWHFGTGLSGVILPGQETPIFAHSLPAGSTGALTHFWSTCTAECEAGTVVRFYVDGEKTPSIDFTPSMAAGVGFDDGEAPWGTKWMGLGAGNKGGQAWFNNFRIPFTKSIVVTVHHASGIPRPGFYIILRGARDLPLEIGGYRLPNTTKLILQKFSGEVPTLGWVNITNVPTGSGIHFASALSVSSGNLNFLEGCYHSYSPYSETFPGTLLSTGTEDYFDSGWYFNAGKFRFPVAGETHRDDSKGKVTWSAYRLHEMDPLRFEDGLRIAWRNGDVLDPKTKSKCYTQTGITVGSPTPSNVTSYSWVYVW